VRISRSLSSASFAVMGPTDRLVELAGMGGGSLASCESRLAMLPSYVCRLRSVAPPTAAR
jgi:hypothetical protein